MIYIVNSLLVTLFSNEFLELICLHTSKWFQVFLSNTIILSNIDYFFALSKMFSRIAI